MKRIQILLCAALLFVGCAQKKEDPPEKPTVAVKVASAEVADLPQVVSASATVCYQHRPRRS